jgi:class 3 adenylate cyclase
MIRQLLGRERFLYVAFVDIVDSVGLYRRLGDWDAKREIDRALAHVERRLVRHEGRVIKHNGDGLLCAFGAAEQAFDALSDAQRETKLPLRVGVHAGSVLMKRRDMFGNAVNIASRLAALAGPGQIVVSANVRERLCDERRSRCRRFDRLRIRGTGAEFELFQINADTGAVTALVTQVVDASIRHTLELRIGSREIRLSSSDSELVLGRDPSCGLVIDDPRASRFHATLELRRGRFVLRDHSTNGSFVLANDGTRATLIRREEWLLSGSGQLSLGRPFVQLNGKSSGGLEHAVAYRLT